jgi:hypothetical protein
MDDVPIDDETLTMLALAADPDAPIPSDAVPFGSERPEPALLPAWYMPAPASFRRSRGRVAVVAMVVVSLLALNAVGLCVTYGIVEIAW